MGNRRPGNMGAKIWLFSESNNSRQSFLKNLLLFPYIQYRHRYPMGIHHKKIEGALRLTADAPSGLLNW